ncbi:MAG: M20 family metallopeptidase [Kineosporiaceae bacterium]|jgi:amidohydrolase
MSLLDDALDLAEPLTELRHALHRHPELGLDLPRTQQTVLDALDGLGLEISTGRSCTSVTAVLRGGAHRTSGAGPAGPVPRTRPVVLLRGDMDALPVHEDLDLPFRSEVDGVMHACGHDLHTTMLVGAARLLSAHRDHLPGDVVFMFQPGEEGHDGAALMIADGVLDAAGRRPDAAFAIHVMSALAPIGAVVTRPGPLMAASDGLYVEVRGHGGHGSSPHTARDPLPAACAMVLALQQTMTREVSAYTPAVLTVGSLHSGTKRNIIPDTATFEATVRTFDPQVRERIRRAVERTCRGTADAHAVEVTVRYVEEYPVTVNDPVETAFALDVARDLFGAGVVAQLPDPTSGSEDFSRILAEVPGAMVFLGAMPAGVAPDLAPINHSPRAAFDDTVLPRGAALYAALADARLARTPSAP